jgi:enoyl-CoA hydratase/carnithine racemase
LFWPPTVEFRAMTNVVLDPFQPLDFMMAAIALPVLVPAGAAVEAALELAAVIAANAPLAVRASQQILHESRDWPRSEAFARQDPIARVASTSGDAREGALAFTEKRPPVWRGE